MSEGAGSVQVCVEILAGQLRAPDMVTFLMRTQQSSKYLVCLLFVCLLFVFVCCLFAVCLFVFVCCLLFVCLLVGWLVVVCLDVFLLVYFFCVL